MATHWQVITSISTVPTMLGEADFLIALAESHDEKQAIHTKTLAASAAVVLAVCLDQGTLCVLDMAARTAQTGDGGREAAAIRALFSDTLRRRVVGLPMILTNSKFQLDSRSPHVRAVHDLITLRNDLMHVSEEADISDLRVSDARDDAAIDAAAAPPGMLQSSDLQKHFDNTPAPEITNPWLFVRLEDVRTYRAAVKLYVEEVLFPPSNVIGQGKIVNRNSERRRW